MSVLHTGNSEAENDYTVYERVSCLLSKTLSYECQLPSTHTNYILFLSHNSTVSIVTRLLAG